MTNRESQLSPSTINADDIETQTTAEVNKESGVITVFNDCQVLQVQMSSLFNDKDLSDVVINVGDKTYNVVKSILAMSSEYFRKMFSSEWKESKTNEINLVGDSKECVKCFEAFLRYIYTYTVDVTLGNVLYFLMLADKYLVPQLTQSCLKHMCSNYNCNANDAGLTRVYSWLCYSQKAGHNNLEQLCVNLLSWNLKVRHLVEHGLGNDKDVSGKKRLDCSRRVCTTSVGCNED
uniref:Trishanku-like n=1 Tax=Saccoglossus kowalevskii TaxID=10224 RepID=A0ABM0GYU0_SACKO|nr:PREDICTED: trishanku-like [Saccoglossus kowalevskii]